MMECYNEPAYHSRDIRVLPIVLADMPRPLVASVAEIPDNPPLLGWPEGPAW